MVADKKEGAEAQLRIMMERIAALIRLADEGEEHAVAAILCEAHDHLRRRLDGGA